MYTLGVCCTCLFMGSFYREDKINGTWKARHVSVYWIPKQLSITIAYSITAKNKDRKRERDRYGQTVGDKRKMQLVTTAVLWWNNSKCWWRPSDIPDSADKYKKWDQNTINGAHGNIIVSSCMNKHHTNSNGGELRVTFFNGMSLVVLLKSAQVFIKWMAEGTEKSTTLWSKLWFS